MTLYGGVIGSPLNTDNPLTARQNLGMEIRNDFGWKEGPSSYVAPGKANWNQAGQQGTSLNATGNAGYITVNETGYYHIIGWHRSGAGNYAYISLNGDRASLEGRSDNLWGHDHAGNGEGWAKGEIIGYLAAGWNIAFGPASNYGQFSINGYSGGLLIIRLR